MNRAMIAGAPSAMQRGERTSKETALIRKDLAIGQRIAPPASQVPSFQSQFETGRSRPRGEGEAVDVDVADRQSFTTVTRHTNPHTFNNIPPYNK